MLANISLLNCEEIKKLRLSGIMWDELLKDKTVLYKHIADLLLDSENLLYYVTQKESTKTLLETRQYIKKLIRNNTIDVNINEIMTTIGWDDDTDINNTIFQGDLAEYLMNILLDKFTNLDTLISKVSLKTSESMPVYGNDNVYFDYENDVLYFGESKFYNDTQEALKKALSSVEKHANIKEILFVKNHTSCFIAENNVKREKVEEKLDEISAEDIIFKSIIFIMSDDVYAKQDYEKMIVNFFGGEEYALNVASEVIMVFLPILSKSEFLNYFLGRIKHERS